jgi:hypothetical protein
MIFLERSFSLLISVERSQTARWLSRVMLHVGLEL